MTGNQYNGIRDFLASEPMGGDLPEPGQNPTTDPLNLGDYGFDIVGPEVHADGEIWVAVAVRHPRPVPHPLPVAGRRSATSPARAAQVAGHAVPG